MSSALEHAPTKFLNLNEGSWLPLVLVKRDSSGIEQHINSSALACALQHLHPVLNCRAAGEASDFSVETIGSHPVALGGYSDVWKGELQRSNHSTRELVAIKVLRFFGANSNNHTFAKNLQREVRIWSMLNHESIAVLHGIVYHSDGRPAMISPWYTNGTADVFLQNNPMINPMKIIWEIVLGVEYLHNNGIVHGDLKGANVMVDDLGHAKLIDFGLSRLIDTALGTSGFTLSNISFSLRWCAPELVLVDNAKVTKATDVYAFASTGHQLLTGDIPYSSQGEITVLRTVMNKSPPQRPTFSNSPIINGDRIWDLLSMCWADPQQRPNIFEVKDQLRLFYP
ncbi:kinase-like protein [Ramaria rubella]|nr:kinase-like protein [Ramaria rubella]